MPIPDALDMFHIRDRQMAAAERELPLCSHCYQYIHDEEYHDIEGTILCPGCLKDHYTKRTEDFIA